MTLRTPRRRISPRTKRRYRAIREFFRRALGSSSQPDIKISSSIAVNVTDLKSKIVGLEQQLDEVNKHCQDIAGLDCSRRESDSYYQSETRHDIDTIKEQTESSSERKLNGTETKLIYKSSECNYEKSEESEYLGKSNDINDVNQTQGMIEEYDGYVPRVKNKKSKLHRITEYGPKLHKHRARSVYENLASANSTNSFRSLTNTRMNYPNPGHSGYPSDRRHLKQEHREPIPPQPYKEKRHKENLKRNTLDFNKEPYEQSPNKIRKHKHHRRELDQDFIADIIRRQYRPVKMFGRKESDLSQISAPICRDQEFSIGENIQEGPELCSCCYDGNKQKSRRSELSDMRSICDTRLYSSKKHPRVRHRRMHVDLFNNSDHYDLIPVKEKSSPKTRKKFTENFIPYEYYREVPPSPRTLRPKLNLKAQYNTELEDYIAHVKHSYRKPSPHRLRRQRERIDPETDMTSEPMPNIIPEQLQRKFHKNMTCQVENQELCQQDNGTVISSQYPTYLNEQANLTVDTTFNKTIETEPPVDKTDKALCEIKDILQNFLHEIKKETNGSQCDKSDVTSKTGDNGNNVIQENSTKLNCNAMPNSRHSFNNYGVGCNPTPFMAPFQNPCCYPMMPVCPINCPMPMQNGFMMPSQSYTCTNCANVAKESGHTEHCCTKTVHTTGTCNTETCHTDTCQTDTCNTETEELIKEIYKFVAQGPARKKDYESTTERGAIKKVDAKMLTSRSVGESSRLSKHDAKVGTPPLKCYSKSCEAIGSRLNTEPYSSATNASYSDTILEKLSLEVSQSTSETEIDTETTEDKSRKNKFSKVLRSMNLFKKKKKDVIEELSESESAIEVDVKPKSPYAQHITNYMMHGQEYYQPPPIPPNYGHHEYQPDYNPPYNPGLQQYIPPPHMAPQSPPRSPRPPIHDIYSPRAQHARMRELATAPPYHPKQRPTAPPYHSSFDNHYNQMQQPQVPLCLREIEVKSIGTQSERKMSIFRKIQKKMQPPLNPDEDYNQNTCSTQTQATATAPQKKVTLPKPLFNWKNLQAKAMMMDSNKLNTDPMKFSLKAQQELAAGDMKMRNAMLKKLFYKRNPFSPRNLIVRTLLGKDKSSFGEAPTMFRPRMFF